MLTVVTDEMIIYMDVRPLTRRVQAVLQGGVGVVRRAHNGPHG